MTLSRSCLSGGPGRRESFWSSKRGETFPPSARSSTGWSKRERKLRTWSRRGPLKLGTLTKHLRKKRSCLPCAWHWADQHFTGPAGSSPALVRIAWVACRIREHAKVARCFSCLGYGHGSRGCGNRNRKNICLRRGTMGHLAKICEFRRLRGRNRSFCSSTSEGEGCPGAPDADCQGEEGRSTAH